MTDDHLAQRYGRNPRNSKRRIWWAIGAAVPVAVLAGWLTFSGVFAPETAIDSQDTAFHTINESTIDVEFNLSAPPGSTVSCAVQALNHQYTIVGWKVVTLGPFDKHDTSHKVRVRTTEPANTGLINRCWPS